LDPDIHISERSSIQILNSLLINDLPFEFANQYCSKTPSPGDLTKFKLSDKDYENFIAFLNSNEFKYSTEMELQASTLANMAKDRKENDEVVNAIQLLKNKIEQSKQSDFVRYKAEITEILEEEIGFHYGLHSGRFKVMQDSDPELQKAIQLIADSGQFKKLLGAN